MIEPVCHRCGKKFENGTTAQVIVLITFRDSFTFEKRVAVCEGDCE